MKRRKREKFIQVFFPKFVILGVIAGILLYLTMLGIKFRELRQVEEISNIMDEEMEFFIDWIVPNGNVDDWKESANMTLSEMEAQVHNTMPGSKVFGYLGDLHGSKIDAPGQDLYLHFYEMKNSSNIFGQQTFVCEQEYLESLPELTEYLKSIEEYKSDTVWENWFPKKIHKCDLTILDGYVDPETHKFYLGNCRIDSMDTEFVGKDMESTYQWPVSPIRNLTTEYIDLTPKDVSGLLKYTSGEDYKSNTLSDGNLYCVGKWIHAGTDTYEEASRCKNDFWDTSTHISKEFKDSEGNIYQLFLIVNDNLAEAYHEVFIFIGMIYMSVAFLISLLISILSYRKLCYFYRNEDYRKALMNSMAHDLRTPLTVMSGYAENLCENVQTDKREHYARSILENVSYMNEIVSDITTLSKLEENGITGKQEKSDLCQIMTELKEGHAALLKEKELTISIEGSFKCKIEKESMKRALDNLLMNAIRYSPKGGTIHIVGRAVPVLKHEIYIENPFEEQIKVKEKKLWEPFVKGDESRSNRNGTGLGLSIARGILENQGFKAKIRMKENRFIVSIQK